MHRADPLCTEPKLHALIGPPRWPCSHALMKGGISKALIEIVSKRPWMWQLFHGCEKEKKKSIMQFRAQDFAFWVGGSDKLSFALVIRK